MEILLLNNFFTVYGGAEKVMFRTAELLEEKGNKVQYFCTNKKPYIINDYEYTKYFTEYTNFSKFSAIKKITTLPKSFYNTQAEKDLSLLLREIKPDVIHGNGLIYNLTPSVLNACAKNNLPIVMTMHDCNLLCPAITFIKKNKSYCNTHDCINGNALHCITNKCFQNNLFKSTIAAMEFTYRRFHKLYDKISYFICPTEAIQELALKANIPSSKLIVLEHFIDVDNKPNYDNKNYFLYVGRLSKEKGIITLLNAMKNLPDIELHIVGNGEEEENIKNEISRLNLKNIKLLGYRSGKDLNNEYKNCIAGIVPSTAFEMFGLIIIEAFRYGKPVIGTNIGGIAKIIGHNKNGILFPVDDSKKLAEEIKKLYDNPELVKELGKNARHKVENKYSPDVHYEKLMNIYNRAAF